MRPLLTFGVLLLMNSCAYAQGISFLSPPGLRSAGSVALKEKKLIFIDMYTTWCGPCKYMDKQVFTNQEVGKYFNRQYVSIKLDAEKGEGVSVAEKYNVHSYPTFLFLTPAGELVLRHEGALEAEDLVSTGKAAVADMHTAKPLSRWDAEYRSGKRDTAFLLAYLQKRKKLGLETGFLVEDFVSAFPAEAFLSKPVKDMVGWNTAPFGKNAYHAVLAWYRADPYNYYLTGSYYALERSLQKGIAAAVQRKDDEFLDNLRAEMHRIYADTAVAGRNFQSKALAYYRSKKDSTGFLYAAKAYVQRFVLPLNQDSLHRKDTERFLSGVQALFNTTDTVSLRHNKRYTDFRKSYRTEADGILADLLGIGSYYCNICRVRPMEPAFLAELRQWLKYSQNLNVRNNPFTAAETKSIKDCLATAGEKL